LTRLGLILTDKLQASTGNGVLNDSVWEPGSTRLYVGLQLRRVPRKEGDRIFSPCLVEEFLDCIFLDVCTNE
jgi:hypothetical protein